MHDDNHTTPRTTHADPPQAALEQLVAERTAELNAMLACSRAILNMTTFKECARAIFDTAREMIGAASGYVALLNEHGDENEVLFLEAGGLPCTVDPELPMPIRGLRAEAYKSGTAAFDNTFAHSPWMQFMPAGHVDLHNVLFAPLMQQQRAVGLIGLANKPGDFTQKDANLALAFGEFASIALSNSRNLDRIRESQQQLVAALAQADSASRYKSEFLTHTSHEIRTPLNAIIGLSDFALRTRDTSAMAEHLTTIRSASHHLLTVINDILDFSRIEAGTLDLFPVDFNLANIIHSLQSSFAPQASLKGITLETHVAQDLPAALRGDADRLQQILFNLTANALKFTDSGSVTVSLGIAPGQVPSPQQVRLQITVRDTGIGIAPEHREIIFDSFKQADGSLSRRHGGAGLGLAITKKLVSLMDGSITVDSTPGLGSTFTITLPFARVHGEPPEPIRLPAGEDAAAAPSPLRIVLAEDNAMNARVACLMLEEAGHSVEHTTGGAQTIDALARADFDIVLMDIEMPGMDGIEATQRIRSGAAGERNCGIPIVAMTAHAFVGFHEKCLAAGMNDYLPKPLDYAQLLQAVGRAAGRAAQPPRVPAAQPAATSPPGVLNRAGALQKLDNNEQILAKMQAMFLSQIPAIEAELAEALASNNCEQVTRIAHKYKSSAGTVGADECRRLLLTIETAGKSGSLPDAAAEFARLKSALAAVKQALEEAPA